MASRSTWPAFHELLEHHRRAHGLSFHQLAERAWTTPSYVFRVCKGEAKPGYTLVLRLAIAMGLPLEEADELVRAAGYVPLVEIRNAPTMPQDG